MESQNNLLTEWETRALARYAEVLRQYVDPEISRYSPIGWRKLPKIKRIEAVNVHNERNMLESMIGIRRKYSIGKWVLDLNKNKPQLDDFMLVMRVQDLVPIKSARKELLDYLATNALPEKFPEFSFSVFDSYIPCNGDCSWDCA